jgi:outer membrane protein assembly factor BamB
LQFRLRQGRAPRPSNGRGIIPQHIVAHALLPYVLLLCLCLGACPQAFAGQQNAERKRLPVPLLPAEEAWAVSLPSPPSAQGALDEARTYIPLQSGQIVALNRETGVVEWSVALASSWAPVVSDGVLYAASAEEFQAIHASTGNLSWRTVLDTDLLAAPAIQGDTIFLLARPNQLVALHTANGSEAWRHTIDGPINSPTMVANAAGVFVSSGSHLSRYAESDGHLEWERELSGVLSPPAFAADRVFVGSTDNNFYALEASTGRLAYRLRAGGDVVGAAANDQFVYVASLDNLLRALRRGTGNQVWKRNLSTRTTAPPSTFGGIVLVTGNDPTLTTFDAASGAPIANFSLAADLQGVPLVDSTPEPFRVAIVVVTRDARAIGLRPTGMMFRELPLSPIQTLPGRPLSREPLSLPNSRPPTSNSQPPTSNSQTFK